jgi:hypothetical protein
MELAKIFLRDWAPSKLASEEAFVAGAAASSPKDDRLAALNGLPRFFRVGFPLGLA